MQHLAVDDVGLNRHLSIQLALESEVEMVRTDRRKIVRIQRTECIRLLRQQNLRGIPRPRVLGVLLCAERRKLREERAVGVPQ